MNTSIPLLTLVLLILCLFVGVSLESNTPKNRNNITSPQNKSNTFVKKQRAAKKRNNKVSKRHYPKKKRRNGLWLGLLKILGYFLLIVIVTALGIALAGAILGGIGWLILAAFGATTAKTLVGALALGALIALSIAWLILQYA